MNIAVLGAGSMGGVHVRAYQNISNVKVAYVYGRSLEKTRALAEQAGATATSALDEILRDPTVEAVDVCVPSHMHREFVIAALNAGKHVFCETPLALKMDDAQAMLAASRKNKKLLLVGLLMRSVPEYRYLKDAIARGELGTALSAHAYRLGSYLRSDAFGAEHLAEPTMELMTFDFDALNWMLGKPSTIFANGTQFADGGFGHVAASLQYDHAMALVEASGTMPPSFPQSVGLRISGENMALEIRTRFPDDGPPETTLTAYPAGAQAHVVTLESGNPYAMECRFFLECIQGKADPSFLSAERAIEALELSLATQRSLGERRAVLLG